jgi:hypothetical protein
MISEVSLPILKEHATGRYAEPDESSLHLPGVFVKIYYNARTHTKL